MCLPDFKRFEQISEDSPIIGYRIWRNEVNNTNMNLESEYQNYIWEFTEGPHLVLSTNSGIYAYNNKYNNNYNYYNNNNNYYIGGIIYQWGNTAIHKIGQRSEYAKIDTIFNIREGDTKGPEAFINWIKIFNTKINQIAIKYNCKVVNYQDFIESQK